MHTADRDEKPSYLIRDRDTKFTAQFDEVFKYKRELMSGGDLITGWITDFFPYLEDREGRNCRNWSFEQDREIQTSDLPGSLSKMPFVWHFRGKPLSMEFIAGFTAFTQDEEDFSVRPKIGWAIREVNEESSS
ncbi:hypothetical protein CA54_58330 [Symmachiella macrocystis]|uniref:Uncharacterized protein n=1 Tax=Symmachiella macrocystis TaxID=2527985 RepID=A0A5C6AYL7_9PLAN|nr:DUF4419 domain-containing protein [Symmachiella macrocystis]TWU05145.1 hypothetical protein CA54_58330 [Symmachiella macrocystis]